MVARCKPENAQGRPVPPQWVVGGVDLQTGKFFLEMVPERSVARLTPVLQRHILPGSTVWTDCWHGYCQVAQQGYHHEVVNHNENFVDPTTGVHTDNVKSRWAACKAMLKHCFSVHHQYLPDYLDEHVWRSRHLHNGMIIFHHIIAAICVQYPL